MKKELIRAETVLDVKRIRGSYDRENPPRLQTIFNTDGSRLYCIQYAGRGKYSENLAELLQYADKRWGLDLGEALRAAVEEATP